MEKRSVRTFDKYSRDLNAWGILMNFYLFIKVKSGGALVYVLEHRVSLNYRIA